MEEKNSIYRKCVTCDLKVDGCKQLTERTTTGNTKNSEHNNYVKHKEF